MSTDTRYLSLAPPREKLSPVATLTYFKYYTKTRLRALYASILQETFLTVLLALFLHRVGGLLILSQTTMELIEVVFLVTLFLAV
jgi:hypothetical protein